MFTSHTFSRFQFVTVVAVVFLALGVAQYASADLLYSEQFPKTSADNLPISSAGWTGYAKSTCTPCVYYGDESLMALVSPNAGSDGVTLGFGVSKPGLSKNSLVCTAAVDELASIDPLEFNNITFSWDQKCSEVGTPSIQCQLAVKIDTAWFVTGDTFAASDPWATKTVVFSDVSAWHAMTVNPNVELSVAAESSVLPTGAIVAAGLYATGDSTVVKTFRFDNFQINGAPVPEPGTMAIVITGIFGMVAYAWRKRR